MKAPKSAIPKEITAIDLRHNLREILNQVANKHERFLVKRDGIPTAVLLSVAEYKDLEDLVDTWYEQQDPKFQQSLLKARQEIDEGKIATLDDLRRDLQVKEHRGKKRL